MAKVMTTVTNIFAAFRLDLSCASVLPPPEGAWLSWEACDVTAKSVQQLVVTRLTAALS